MPAFVVYNCNNVTGSVNGEKTIMIPIYSPKSESEAAVIASMMQAYGIHFVMQGGAFSSMYPGPLTGSLNAQTLLVEKENAELAMQLIAPMIAE